MTKYAFSKALATLALASSIISINPPEALAHGYGGSCNSQGGCYNGYGGWFSSRAKSNGNHDSRDNGHGESHNCHDQCNSNHGEFRSEHIRPLVLKGNILSDAPQLSLTRRISNLEEQLIRLHDSNRIGSFDIDMLSERLLAIKRNYSVMKAATGNISIAQQRVLIKDLGALREEISNAASDDPLALSL